MKKFEPKKKTPNATSRGLKLDANTMEENEKTKHLK
jgi:hypothetical protein